ncbi:MAG: hypothetical protein Q8L38_12090, partial [Pseudohongiella sp.]|nr:hypothetical protein [Pseudohongiella sp.]
SALGTHVIHRKITVVHNGQHFHSVLLLIRSVDETVLVAKSGLKFLFKADSYTMTLVLSLR